MLAALVLPSPARGQSLDTSGLEALETPSAPAASAAPLNLSDLQRLERPVGAAAGLNLSGLQALEGGTLKADSGQPELCPCPAGCRCAGGCVCDPQRSMLHAQRTDGWACDVYGPTWCGHCKTMQSQEAGKAQAAGLPIRWIFGDESTFPAWVVASANSSPDHGWPLIHIHNRSQGIGWQVWGRRTVETLQALIADLKKRTEPPAVPPPQARAQWLNPAIPALKPRKNGRCGGGRCVARYGESGPVWV